MVRATNLIQKLKQADVGSRPIIWVGHSMGGKFVHIQKSYHILHGQKHTRCEKKAVEFFSQPFVALFFILLIICKSHLLSGCNRLFLIIKVYLKVTKT